MTEFRTQADEMDASLLLQPRAPLRKRQRVSISFGGVSTRSVGHRDARDGLTRHPATEGHLNLAGTVDADCAFDPQATTRFEADTIDRASRNLDDVQEQMKSYYLADLVEPGECRKGFDTAIIEMTQQMISALTGLRESSFRGLAATAAALEHVVEGLGAIRFTDGLGSITSSLDHLLHGLIDMQLFSSGSMHTQRAFGALSTVEANDGDPATAMQRLADTCDDITGVVHALHRAGEDARLLGTNALLVSRNRVDCSTGLKAATETISEYASSLASGIALLSEQLLSIQQLGRHALRAMSWVRDALDDLTAAGNAIAP